MARLNQRLPFAARVNVPDTVRGAELEIAFTSGASEAALAEIDRGFSQFVAAAEAGMFAGDSAPPSESKWRIVSHDRDDRETRYRCEVRRIDPGAFRILLNLAVEISRAEPLDGVLISGDTAGRRGSDLAEILRRRYPGRAEHLPFAVTHSEFYFENREPLIRMEFRRPPTDEEFERMKEMMGAWDYILGLGGYLDPDARDGDILPEPGEFYLSEPLVVEHLIYAYQGPAESFNAVINMAVRLHHSGCQLTTLEIE